MEWEKTGPNFFKFNEPCGQVGSTFKRLAMRYDTDPDILKKQVVVETYRSGGPGGQRKNKVETAVRLKHLPSGITVIATEYRSQAENRKLAIERLRERLMKLNQRRRRRIPTSISLKTIERRREEKKALSKKKRLRQESLKMFKEWD
jgi:protein subunit release factor B